MLSANTVRYGQSLAFPLAALSLEHKVRATERWFRVDHPVLSEQWPQPGGEDFGLSERSQVSIHKGDVGRGGGDRKYKLLNKACALYALQSSTLSNRNKQNSAPSNHQWLGRLGADAGSFAPVFLENRKNFYYAEGANSLRSS